MGKKQAVEPHKQRAQLEPFYPQNDGGAEITLSDIIRVSYKHKCVFGCVFLLVTAAMTLFAFLRPQLHRYEQTFTAPMHFQGGQFVAIPVDNEMLLDKMKLYLKEAGHALAQKNPHKHIYGATQLRWGLISPSAYPAGLRLTYESSGHQTASGVQAVFKSVFTYYARLMDVVTLEWKKANTQEMKAVRGQIGSEDSLMNGQLHYQLAMLETGDKTLESAHAGYFIFKPLPVHRFSIALVGLFFGLLASFCSVFLLEWTQNSKKQGVIS